MRRLIKWCFVLGLWGVLLLGAVLAWFAKDLPNIIENPHFERKISITVLANDDSVIARYGDIKEGNVTADDLPKNVTNAILATEDRRFYYHFGLDPAVVERLPELASRIALVQLGDARRPPQGEQDRCRLGDGEIPLPEIVRRLTRGGYDGFYELELLGEEIESFDYAELLKVSKDSFEQLVTN